MKASTIDKSFLDLVAKNEALQDQIETLEASVKEKTQQLRDNFHEMQEDTYNTVCVIALDEDNKFIDGLKSFYEQNGFFTQKQSEAFFKSYDHWSLKEFC